MTETLRGVAFRVRAARAAHRTGTGATRALVGGGLAALSLFAAAGTARAQYVEPAARKPYAFRIGDYIPTEAETRQFSGTHVLALEFDYTVQQLPERSSISVLSLGYIERGDFRMIPLTISQIWRDPGSRSEVGQGYYYGLGGGLYNVRLSTPETSGELKWLPGGFVVAGIDITEKFFAEIKYHYISKYDRKFVGGTMISVGTRF